MPTREMVIAVYDGFQTANSAFQALLDEGFFRADVGLVAVDQQDYDKLNFRFERLDESMIAEMGYSALLASGTFALNTVTLSDVGVVVVAGSLNGMLGGADGAMAGGLTAALVRLGIPSGKAEAYAASLRNGHALVTVQVRTAAALVSAIDILHRSRPVNLKQGGTQGWLGFENAHEREDAPYEVIGRFPHRVS
ncbi:MAG: hypothetical protein LCI00_28265 [Chloroflexi bacterium]|nr:hypothetical protein [Chloroflexota bacterium]